MKVVRFKDVQIYQGILLTAWKIILCITSVLDLSSLFICTLFFRIANITF